jgi:hypothetical protein
MSAKIAIVLLLGLLPCAAEREKFADERFSLEFPEGWRKPAQAGEPAPLLVRENKTGTALFAVTRMEIPAGSKVDLDATAKTIAESYQKDLKMEKAAEAAEGEVDGLSARFLTIIPPPAAEGESVTDAARAAYYLVLVDSRKELLILQATLALPAPKDLREETLAIIMSFKREE